MSFAALESRVNASVLKHLANVRVLIAGEDVGGIFRNPSQTVQLGMGVAESRPTLSLASSAVPSAPVGTELEIDGVPYIVSAEAPDGTGITVLFVERTE